MDNCCTHNSQIRIQANNSNTDGSGSTIMHSLLFQSCPPSHTGYQEPQLHRVHALRDQQRGGRGQRVSQQPALNTRQQPRAGPPTERCCSTGGGQGEAVGGGERQRHHTDLSEAGQQIKKRQAPMRHDSLDMWIVKCFPRHVSSYMSP